MDIQLVFYWLGSFFVLMWIVLLLVMIGGMLYVIRTIQKTTKIAEEKMQKGIGGAFLAMIPLLPLIVELVQMIRTKKRSE